VIYDLPIYGVLCLLFLKVLLEQLKELEEDGIVHRKQVNTFPPEVYYGLTDKGRSLAPLMQEIEQWTMSLQNN
jgi:DNA-binding HxlR family transcriptional regulator